MRSNYIALPMTTND